MSMPGRRFFATVWKINSVLILLVSVLASGVLAVAGYSLLRDAMRIRRVDNVATTALGDIQKSSARLGSFDAVRGSRFLKAPLMVTQTYDFASGSKDAGSVRNYLFFDPGTRSAHWLQPSMESLILQTSSLPNSDYERREQDTEVFVYSIVDSDSSGDARLSDSDRKKIAISGPDGKDFRVVVEQADRLNDARLISPGKLLVIYSLGTNLRGTEVDLLSASAKPVAFDIKLPEH